MPVKEPPVKEENLVSAADTYIVSDVHLGNRHCHRQDFRQFLDDLPEGACLVLNGDIVDEPDDPLSADDEQILSRLAEESHHREVVWVYGNHDEAVSVQNPGKIQFVERWAIERRLLVMHGDEHDGVMPRHGVFKKIFKSLHRLRVWLGFDDVHVADYAKRWGFLYQVLTKHVADKALRTAAREGFEAITCGHTHAPVDLTVDGRRYLNTGCWTESPAWVVVVRADGIDYLPFPASSEKLTGDAGSSDAPAASLSVPARLLMLALLLFGQTHIAEGQKQDLHWPLAMAPALSSTFGETRSTAFHAGIDLKTWGKTGYEVHAAGDGWIERARTSPWGFGRVIYLRLKDGRIAVYAHLDSFFTPVQKRIREEQRAQGHYSVQLWFKEGEIPVRRGQVIAATGQTGGGPPHLHFELRSASNVPMNALLHAFHVADTEAPTMRRLLIVPRGPGSLANGGHEPIVVALRWSAATQRFIASERVTVFGRIGIGVESFDTADAADNKMAALRQALIVDGREVFSSRMQRVPIADGHQVALDRWRHSGHVFATLFQRPGNRLSFYESDGNAGWLFAGGDGLPPGDHAIEVTASDVSGNESRATLTLHAASSYEQALQSAPAFEQPSGRPAEQPAVTLTAYERFAVLRLSGTEPRAVVPGAVVGERPIPLHRSANGYVGLITYAHLDVEDDEAEVQVTFHDSSIADTALALSLQSIRPGQALRLAYDEGRMALHLNAKSAYEELVPQVGAAPPVASPGLRATKRGYRIEPQTVSFDKWARISFAIPDGKDPKKLGVYAGDDEGRWFFIGNDHDDPSQRISARIRAFGHFALLEDLAPPTVSTLAPRSQMWLDERRPILRARVVDHGSGIGEELDLAIELNGKKLIHIYDPEADLVEARPDKPLADGEYVWTVRARDQAGNETEVSDVFGLR